MTEAEQKIRDALVEGPLATLHGACNHKNVKAILAELNVLRAERDDLKLQLDVDGIQDMRNELLFQLGQRDVQDEKISVLIADLKDLRADAARYRWLRNEAWGGMDIEPMTRGRLREIDRERVARGYQRICIGSSGAWSVVGNDAWHHRMAQAMRVVCNDDGQPICKLHGLRMLNPKVFTMYPFASADSTNIGRNVGIDSGWKGTYLPPTKEARATLMRSRIESHNALARYQFSALQQDIFA
jgi:hypothetical protein